jgi:hypothetical protein
LNGILFYKNFECIGSTRGAIFFGKVSKGILRFPGDHGYVAFRNIKHKSFNQISLTFLNLKFGVYKGNFRSVADIEKINPKIIGNIAFLNWNLCIA